MHESGSGIRLTVVMPVYNEVETVAQSTRRVRSVPLDIEMVCVDDGSTDGTRDELRRLEADGVIHRLILHPKNRGKGAAVRTGIAAATGDVIASRTGRGVDRYVPQPLGADARPAPAAAPSIPQPAGATMTAHDRVSEVVHLALVMLGLSLVVPGPAAAYIDPLSGSIILQVLAAGFFATMFTLKRFWRRAADAVLRRRTRRDDP